MAMTTEMHLRETVESRYRFDYKGMHRYLITLPAFKSRSVFTGREIIIKILDILREGTWQYHFDVYAYCILPDRFVAIIRGKTEYSDMKAFLSNFRTTSSTAFQSVLGHPLWKRTYLERVLRKQEDSDKIAAEVFALPVKEGLIAADGDYPFRGSFVKSIDAGRPRPHTSPTKRFPQMKKRTGQNTKRPRHFRPR